MLAAAGSFPDALSVSALAAAQGMPILLTGGDTLAAEAAALLGPDTDVLIVGGTAVVGEQVALEADAIAGEVRRIAGDGRYATSALIAEEAIARGLSDERIWLATGRSFPDGLVAGVAAGALNAPLLLIDGETFGPAAAVDLLDGLTPGLVRVDVAGGAAAVAETAIEQVTAIVG